MKHISKNEAKRQAAQFITYRDQNRMAIQKLLKEHWPTEHAVMQTQIDAALADGQKGKAFNLSLPPMAIGLLSLLLNNMSLYLGNTQQFDKMMESLQNAQ